MKKLVENMRFCDNMEKKTKKPFQKGILISIQSTMSLFKELKNEGVDFLHTAKLNQDCLENFFSRLRGVGGNNNHPAPVEAMDRVRILL